MLVNNASLFGRRLAGQWKQNLAGSLGRATVLREGAEKLNSPTSLAVWVVMCACHPSPAPSSHTLWLRLRALRADVRARRAE